jgi:uncharacterized protein YqeY
LDRVKIPDEVVISVLISYKKSLQKGVEQLSVGGVQAETLISEYNEEIKVCEEYIPNELEVTVQLEDIISQAIVDLSITSEKQIGVVIGHIMKNNKGLDGKLIKDLVTKRLGG